LEDVVTAFSMMATDLRQKVKKNLKTFIGSMTPLLDFRP
jgi:hypothetical protein